MRIGIDIRLIGRKRTGDEAVFFNLVKNIAQIKTIHEFYLFTDETDKEILNEIAIRLGIDEKDNFKIVSLETKNRFSWNFWTLPIYLRKNPIDLYLTQYITPWFVPRSIKIVTIVHDISFNFFPQFIKFADLFFLRMLIPVSLRRADKILGVSEFTKNEIVNFYKIDPEKIDYIYNSIGDEFLNKNISPEEKQQVSLKYGLPEKFILYLGTLQPRKNVPFLIEAFAKIHEQMPEFKLVIAGSREAHNFDKKIDLVIEKHQIANKIIFTGYIDEKDKKVLYSLSKSFIFPSCYEGFGIPVLEAMSQGVPVLASDIPSLKEIAADGALFGEISSPESVDKFSRMIYDISVNDELRDNLVSLANERIKFFSWKKTAEKALAIFEKISHN